MKKLIFTLLFFTGLYVTGLAQAGAKKSDKSDLTAIQAVPAAKAPVAASEEQQKAKLADYNKTAQQGKITPSSAVSLGPAPVQNWPVGNGTLSTEAGNPDSRAFNYNGAGPFQLNKQSLLNTALTPVGAPVLFGYPGASAWVTTTNRLYVIDQAAPFSLYWVDTISGFRVFVANCTGVPHANLTGMTWDASTNTMYGVSTSISASQIFTINITTGVCTPIGSPTSDAPGVIMLNASPAGDLFAVDIVNDNLYRFDKTTGVPTVVGPLGYDANFGQDGHFDLSDGQYFHAAYNNTAGVPQLRIIDPTTGASTLVGSYGGQVSTFSIYNPPTVACAGTPAPGNTLVANESSVCAGVNFLLYLQNYEQSTGITYQWQSSPDGTTWTDIAGGTTATLVRSQTAATWYRCQVTCSGNSAASTPVQVALNPQSACYCAAGATSTSFEKISNVTFGTINNNSSSTAGYENFTSLSTDVVQGDNVPISVTISTPFTPDQVLVWIDFNQDGDFTDPGELAYTSALGVGPHVGTVAISSTALLGPTRMRVRLHDSSLGGNATPCGNSSYGQVEDYTVNILPCIPATFAAHPVNVSAVCGSNVTISSTVSGTVSSYNWQWRPNASAVWQTVADGGIYSGATTTALTISGVTADLSGYQYRLLIEGPCAAPNPSNAATLTVTPIIPVVSPSSATICNGAVQQLSLTNTVSAPSTASFSTTGLSIPLINGVANIISATVSVSGIPAGAVVTNVAVGFDMNHTWASDVGGNIEAPNGENLNLVWQIGGSTDNFVGTYFDALSTDDIAAAPAPRTGTFAPMAWTISGAPGFNTTTNDVADLLTGDPNGDWKFYFYDAFAGDNGLLTAVYVTITYTAPVFAEGVWAGPAGTIFTDAAGTVAYSGGLATTVYVRPTVTSNYQVSFSTPLCQSAVTTVPVTVAQPVSNVVSPVNRAICVGANTSFTASASGSPLTYQWQLSTDGGTTWANVANGGIYAGATTTTLTLTGVPQTANNNRYRVVINAGVCAGNVASGAAVLTVNALPVVTISAPDVLLTPPETAIITATSTPAAAAGGWSWTYNNSAIAGNTSGTQTATVDALGSYRATVTDVNGCVASSNVLVIGAEATDKLWIYPNPTDGQFQVRLYFHENIFSENRTIAIFNQLGQLVAKKDLNILRNNNTPYLSQNFDLRHVSPGVYVVRVTHQFTGKMVSGLIVIQ